jgi:hypothetical protein
MLGLRVRLDCSLFPSLEVGKRLPRKGAPAGLHGAPESDKVYLHAVPTVHLPFPSHRAAIELS